MTTTKANIGVIVTGASGSGGDGGGVTFHGLPPGGTTSSSLIKRSDADFDAVWQPPGIEARSYGAIIGRNANMIIPHNLTTQVIMDIVGYDPYLIAGLSNGGNPRCIFLVPGFWIIEARLIWDESGAGTRTLTLNFGGDNIPINTVIGLGGHPTRMAAPDHRDVTTEPFVKLCAYQDSGSPLAITNAHISAVRIGAA